VRSIARARACVCACAAYAADALGGEYVPRRHERALLQHATRAAAHRCSSAPQAERNAD
jgi:hypothetical protein